MSSCSFLVAVMPTREVIGYWAAVILVIARLVQGFATGGEYGTSATYMSEAATAHRRGFFSSFQYVTLVGGHVLAQFTLLISLSFLGVEPLERLGLADRLLHRRRRRAGGALDAPHDGRIAQRIAPDRHPRGQGPGRRIDEDVVHHATGGRCCWSSSSPRAARSRSTPTASTRRPSSSPPSAPTGR